MTQRIKTKTTTGKKAGTRKRSVKKAAKKKASKKTNRKKPALKKNAKMPGKRKTAPKKRMPTSKSAFPKKESPEIVPGPPIIDIPPVEEPAHQELAVGVVTHYYSHLGVAVVQINAGTLRTGNNIRIKGHTTDIAQTVQSLEYEHRHVDKAVAGQSVGLKVVDHVREHDIVYLE